MIKEHVLDSFAKKFCGCTIQDAVFDVSNGFENYPRNFGKCNTVAAYIVKGYPFVEKYYLDDNDVLQIKKFEIEQIVIGSLCLKPIANTSLHEVKGVIDKYNISVQGWNKNSINGVISQIRIKDATFESMVDSAFFFAGKSEEVYSKAHLHKLWLKQILETGENALKIMSIKESILFEKIFSAATLNGDSRSILNDSYNFGKQSYLLFSTEFLRRKVELYKKGSFEDD